MLEEDADVEEEPPVVLTRTHDSLSNEEVVAFLEN